MAEPERSARREIHSGLLHYPDGGCSEFPWYARDLDGFGSSFKGEIKRRYPSPVSFEVQAPTLRSDANYMDLDPEVKDPFGIPVARIHFEWDENVLKMWEHSKEMSRHSRRRAENIPDPQMRRKSRASVSMKPEPAGWGTIRRNL